MIEHFKPAGHKAPNMKTAIALEETFKPIQRVLHNDKMIGYLFRELGWGDGLCDVVLAHDIFREGKNGIYNTLPDWKLYLAHKDQNPYRFHVPSGPIIAEISYRIAKNKGPIQKEAYMSLKSTFEDAPIINTLINYQEKTIQHRHFNKTSKPQTITKPERICTTLSDDIDTTTQAFLYALLGQRAAHANTMFNTQKTSLWMPTNNQPRSTYSVVLNQLGLQEFYIGADINAGRPTRGVALAEPILNMKGVEVRDD